MSDFANTTGSFKKPYQSTGGTNNSEIVHRGTQALKPANNALHKFLREPGNSIAMNVDGSVTPVKFRYKVPALKQIHAHDLIFKIEDKGILPARFGGISALTNGLLVEAIADDDVTVLFDFMDGAPIKKNADFYRLADVDFLLDEQNSQDALAAPWKIPDAGAAARLTAGQSLQVTVRDDLTDLAVFDTFLKGLIYDEEVTDFGC